MTSIRNTTSLHPRRPRTGAARLAAQPGFGFACVGPEQTLGDLHLEQRTDQGVSQRVMQLFG